MLKQEQAPQVDSHKINLLMNPIKAKILWRNWIQ